MDKCSLILLCHCCRKSFSLRISFRRRIIGREGLSSACSMSTCLWMSFSSSSCFRRSAASAAPDLVSALPSLLHASSSATCGPPSGPGRGSKLPSRSGSSSSALSGSPTFSRPLISSPRLYSASSACSMTYSSSSSSPCTSRISSVKSSVTVSMARLMCLVSTSKFTPVI